MDWASVASWLSGAWDWLSGPLWAFMNTSFISGLIPAFVGILLTRRVAEVAETNRSVEAARSAEAQVADLDRATRADDVLELQTLVPAAPAAPQAADDAPGHSAETIAALDVKMDAIKQQVEDKIDALGMRRRGKYENIARYDHRPILLMLAGDGAITDKDAYRLVGIFTVWRSHLRKKEHLPADTVAAIRAFEWSGVPKKARGHGRKAAAEAVSNDPMAPTAQPA